MSDYDDKPGTKFYDDADTFVSCISDCKLEGVELDDYVAGVMIEWFGSDRVPPAVDAYRAKRVIDVVEDLRTRGSGDAFYDADVLGRTIDALRRWSTREAPTMAADRPGTMQLEAMARFVERVCGVMEAHDVRSMIGGPWETNPRSVRDVQIVFAGAPPSPVPRRVYLQGEPPAPGSPNAFTVMRCEKCSRPLFVVGYLTADVLYPDRCVQIVGAAGAPDPYCAEIAAAFARGRVDGSIDRARVADVLVNETPHETYAQGWRNALRAALRIALSCQENGFSRGSWAVDLREIILESLEQEELAKPPKRDDEDQRLAEIRTLELLRTKFSRSRLGYLAHAVDKIRRDSERDHPGSVGGVMVQMSASEAVADLDELSKLMDGWR